MCRHVSIWGFQNRVCLSVHLSAPREKKSPWLLQYQSYISIWYINGKVFTSTTPWKPKNWNSFQKSSKLEFWLVLQSWNHLSFVNISPTLVIDTSMESSLRVLQHENPKIWIFFIKVRNSNFDWFWRAEITIASSISVLHLKLINQWKDIHEYYSMETQKFEFYLKKFKTEFWLVLKSWNYLSFVMLNAGRILVGFRNNDNNKTGDINYLSWIP